MNISKNVPNECNLFHYSKPLYNLLGRGYNLKILHSGVKTLSEDEKYEKLVVPKYLQQFDINLKEIIE